MKRLIGNEIGHSLAFLGIFTLGVKLVEASILESSVFAAIVVGIIGLLNLASLDCEMEPPVPIRNRVEDKYILLSVIITMLVTGMVMIVIANL